MTVGQVRTKDLPDTGSIAGTDTVLVDNGAGTRSKTITEIGAAILGASQAHWEHKWSGIFFCGAGAVSGWLQDFMINTATLANVPIEYPISHNASVGIADLVVKVLSNTSATSATCVVTIAGADQTITVTIPAGTTGSFKDTAHTVTGLHQGDSVGIAIHNTGGGGGSSIFVTVSLRYYF